MRPLYLSAFIVTLLLSVSAQAKSNILFILDGSNSMWGQIGGETKIASAQKVLGELLTDLPSDTSVGLMSYGHRSKVSCTDIELLSPIGADKPDALAKKIRSIQPKGKTPIAAALNASVNAFAKHEGENNHVVLISDGLESCGGDPCAAAGMLASANIKARVHVVGFDIVDEERKKLKCIPKMGNGKYFSASNAKELKVAVAEVKKEAAKPPPEAPVTKEYFRDNFDGNKLAEHWEVLKPDPDSFIVEDGKLLIVNGSVGKREDLSFSNLFRLKKPLPKGDWVTTVKLKAEFAANNEGVFLGMINDKENGLYAWLNYNTNSPDNSWITIYGIKRSKGVEKNHNIQIFNWIKAKDLQQMSLKPYYLRIAKSGRSYVVSVKHSDDDKANWTVLKKLSILSQKGRIAIGSTQGKVGVESTILIDWIKIEVSE